MKRNEQDAGWIASDSRVGLVSVVVPCFNRERFIGETLDSIAIQTYRPIQLIVVDDGSSDGSADAVESWFASTGRRNNIECQLIRQVNAGASSARNAGTQVSLGEYIQYLDSDDLLSAEKISRQVTALKAETECGFAYSPVCELYGDGVPLYGRAQRSREDLLYKQISSPYLTTIGPLLRREVVRLVGPWREDMRFAEDWEYHLRMVALDVSGKFVPGAVALYRNKWGHDGSPRLSHENGPRDGDVWLQTHLARLASGIKNAVLAEDLRKSFVRMVAKEVNLLFARSIVAGLSNVSSARVDAALAEVGCAGERCSRFWRLLPSSVAARVLLAMERLTWFLKVRLGRVW